MKIDAIENSMSPGRRNYPFTRPGCALSEARFLGYALRCKLGDWRVETRSIKIGGKAQIVIIKRVGYPAQLITSGSYAGFIADNGILCRPLCDARTFSASSTEKIATYSERAGMRYNPHAYLETLLYYLKELSPRNVDSSTFRETVNAFTKRYGAQYENLILSGSTSD